MKKKRNVQQWLSFLLLLLTLGIVLYIGFSGNDLAELAVVDSTERICAVILELVNARR